MTKPDCVNCPLGDSPQLEVVHPAWDLDVLFIGGCPTKRDAVSGRPFRGEGGKLLRQMLSQCGFKLEKVSYTHACLCKPAGSKPPTAKAIKACQGRLLDEMRQASPTLVVPMGNVATAAILGGGRGITKRRGIYQEVNGLRVIPTLDPESVFASPESYPDLLQDLQFILSVLEDEDPVIPPPAENYCQIRTQAGFDKVLSRLQQMGRTSVDIETTGLDFFNDRILSIGFSWKVGTSCIIDWQALLENQVANLNALSEVLGAIECYPHNGQFDILWLNLRGIQVNYARDTMLGHYALDERQGSHGLKRLSIQRYRSPEYDDTLKALIRTRRDIREEDSETDADEDDESESVKVTANEEDRKAPLKITLEDWQDEVIRRAVMEYNGADADYTFRLSQDLWEDMDSDDKSVHDRLLLPAAKHFIDLERTGMLVDVDYHNALGEKWKAEIEELETELRSYPGAEEMNFNSPKQVAAYLFDALELKPMVTGLEPIPQSTLLEEIQDIEDTEAQEFWRSSTTHLTTKMTGRSTSTYMLYWLAQQHDFPRILVRHRIVSKKYSSYYLGYRSIMWADCRIRPRYRVHGTRTGRLSSTDPNIHGMPRRKEIKDLFIADPGYTLINADYSQAEIRMMAHFAKDSRLIQALYEQDIHKAISMQLFDMTEEDLAAMSDEERSFRRRAAKTIAFGLMYGRSARSLAPQLGVSLEAAEAYMRQFFRMMPDVTKWISRQQDGVMRGAEVTSLYGRKRRFPIIMGKRHASEVMRQAVNMPIQSSVSDLTLLANLRALESLRAEGIPARPWPHIHDGFLLQVPDHVLEHSVRRVAECMHEVGFETEVPFAVEIGVGKRWGSTKTVYQG